MRMERGEGPDNFRDRNTVPRMRCGSPANPLPVLSIGVWCRFYRIGTGTLRAAPCKQGDKANGVLIICGLGDNPTTGEYDGPVRERMLSFPEMVQTAMRGVWAHSGALWG